MRMRMRTFRQLVDNEAAEKLFLNLRMMNVVPTAAANILFAPFCVRRRPSAIVGPIRAN